MSIQNKHPFLLTIKPAGGMDAQQTMMEGMDSGADTGYISSDASLVFAYRDGVLTYKTSETLTIGDALFNKIKNNPDYKPSKQTVLAFAIALEMSPEEARELLATAGFALSNSSKTDIVVEYFLRNRRFSVMDVNLMLFQLDLPPLGY